jgi:SagB-type dehydrogenase family enzyme
VHRDTSVADKYWHDTFRDSFGVLSRGIGAEGSPDEPPKFKTYRGLPRQRLPQRTAARLGDLAQAFGTAPVSPVDRPIHEAELGLLLYHGYGFSRQDVGAIGGWPHHRFVPSARCFYPTELYVWRPESASCAHYDQLHHSLVELRAGVAPETMSAALGSALDGAVAVLLLTSHFWKTAFRYRHYAHRLCSQEAGMVVGNLLLVGQALGLRGHVHYQFLDSVLDRLLGVTVGEERAVAAIAFYRDGPGAPAAPRRREGEWTSGAMLPALPPIRPDFRDVVKDISLASSVYELASASVLDSTADFADLPGSGPADGAGSDVDLDGVDIPPVDLAAALRERNSGGTLFRTLARSAPVHALARIARYLGRPYASDIGTGPQSYCALIVQDVDGVAPGVYRCTADGRLRRIPGTSERPLDAEAAMALGPPVTDYRRTNLVAFVVTDRARADHFGNRGYRILNQDAGLVAQRLCVLSAAAGLAARPLNGYVVPAVQEILAIDDPDHLPMFQIAIGHRASTAQYEMAIAF